MSVAMEFGAAALALRHGDGGTGTDTVPAMLASDQFAISKGAVRRYGARLRHAIHDMMMPRDAIGGTLAAPMLHDMMRRFGKMFVGR